MLLTNTDTYLCKIKQAVGETGNAWQGEMIFLCPNGKTTPLHGGGPGAPRTAAPGLCDPGGISSCTTRAWGPGVPPGSRERDAHLRTRQSRCQQPRPAVQTRAAECPRGPSQQRGLGLAGRGKQLEKTLRSEREH